MDIQVRVWRQSSHEDKGRMVTYEVQDISPDGQLQHTPDFQTGELKPSGIHVIYGK